MANTSNGTYVQPESTNVFKTKEEELHDGLTMEVLYRKGHDGMTKEQLDERRRQGLRVMFNFCAPLNKRTYEPVPGITCHQDEECILRDGTKIYYDLYMPTNCTEKIPVIVSWSVFGKRPFEGTDDWKLMGVPPKTVSNMCKFESPDPGYWCRHGYAVANVDARGVGNNEGDVSNFGPQDGRDGADFVEHIAVKDWCNGKVGFGGNSGVAMVQWRIAAEQPPHLACIVPWEGTGDMYRESIMPGGIWSPGMNESVCMGIAANQFVEDCNGMLKDHPFMDEYWEAKVPRWHKIKCPAYVSAGWCHLHLHGSIEGFRRIRSPKKWLRIHREFEWPDAYNPYNLQELHMFYDRYLKDINNGWELMPKIRMDVMDVYDYDFQSKREEMEFPLKRTRYEKLYLDAANRTASPAPVAVPAEVEYDPETEMVTFDYKFEEDTEITGFMKLRLWVEARGHDNMDMFVWIKKLGEDGQEIPIHSMREPYRGAWGYLRAKRRELDPKLATDFQPVLAHKRDLPLSPGEIVPVDIEIWPHSRIWHKGESIRIEVEGKFWMSEWYEDPKMKFVLDNGEGKHVLHTGGEHESYLQIPVIPPKYKCGNYVYR